MTKPKPPATDPKASSLGAKVNEPSDALIAALATVASLPAAQVVKDYSTSTLGEVSLGQVLHSLEDYAGTIKNGDLTRAETMLCGQAAALNTMFGELARRGAVNMGQYIGAAETYLRLALRAQNQCRATLETLATIKNPPVIFAQQANIAHGPQQVNNGSASLAEQIENRPSELLEDDHEQRLDIRTTTATSRSNPPLEAVGAVDRPAKRRREGQDKP